MFLLVIITLFLVCSAHLSSMELEPVQTVAGQALQQRLACRTYIRSLSWQDQVCPPCLFPNQSYRHSPIISRRSPLNPSSDSNIIPHPNPALKIVRTNSTGSHPSQGYSSDSPGPAIPWPDSQDSQLSFGSQELPSFGQNSCDQDSQPSQKSQEGLRSSLSRQGSRSESGMDVSGGISDADLVIAAEMAENRELNQKKLSIVAVRS